MNKREDFIEMETFEKTYLLKSDKDKYITNEDTSYTKYGTVYNKLVSKSKALLNTEIKNF